MSFGKSFGAFRWRRYMEDSFDCAIVAYVEIKPEYLLQMLDWIREQERTPRFLSAQLLPSRYNDSACCFQLKIRGTFCFDDLPLAMLFYLRFSENCFGLYAFE